MTYLLTALAVYKVVQMLDLLTPREAMPWVKVVAGIVLGYGASFLVDVENRWTAGLTIATLAGACHGVLRLVTLLGDMAQRKSVK